MVQQKMQEKYKAIVEAAIAVFAARGFWDTPTALVSRTAGVAEGTLFNYFQTKDDLINAVYLTIKQELADVLLEGIAAATSLHDKMQHIWNCYIEWGLSHPGRFKVLNQIGVSYQLNDAVKAAGNEPYVELERLARESIERGEIRDYPVTYLALFMSNHAVMTIQFIARNEDRQVDYQKIGFEILWNSIAC